MKTTMIMLTLGLGLLACRTASTPPAEEPEQRPQNVPAGWVQFHPTDVEACSSRTAE